MPVKKERIQLTLTKPYLDALVFLVDEGIYLERVMAIRDALRRLFVAYKIPPFYPEAEYEAREEEFAEHPREEEGP